MVKFCENPRIETSLSASKKGHMETGIVLPNIPKTSLDSSVTLQNSSFKSSTGSSNL